MSQAAVSERESAGFSSEVMEQAEVCSVPGGLANIRKQFERDDTSSAHTITQFHHTHKSVQEVFHQSVQMEVAPNGEDHRVADKEDEEEFYPKLSARELAQQFEKTIEEAAPNKKIKIRVPKSEMCQVCQKRVYPMEGLIADKKMFHKSCFSCEYCRTKLSLGNYVSLRGRLYCSPHFKQLFKSQGNFHEGFGQGCQKGMPNATIINRNSEGNGGRYSLSQRTDSEKTNSTPKKLNKKWPPQTDSPKKALILDPDLQLVKPVWPPTRESSESPKLPK